MSKCPSGNWWVSMGASTTPTVSDDHLSSRGIRRYPSDTTDTEWQVIAPLILAGRPSRRGGRQPRHPRCDIVDAIRQLAHNGCVWRDLVRDAAGRDRQTTAAIIDSPSVRAAEIVARHSRYDAGNCLGWSAMSGGARCSWLPSQQR